MLTWSGKGLRNQIQLWTHWHQSTVKKVLFGILSFTLAWLEEYLGTTPPSFSAHAAARCKRLFGNFYNSPAFRNLIAHMCSYALVLPYLIWIHSLTKITQTLPNAFSKVLDSTSSSSCSIYSFTWQPIKYGMALLPNAFSKILDSTSSSRYDFATLS